MFGLFGMGYDFDEINAHILSVSETLQKTEQNHKDEPNQNSMSI
jgi:hypothetical protein